MPLQRSVPWIIFDLILTLALTVGGGGGDDDDDDDDAHVLTLIRMWSGFESEMITDGQLTDLLGFEDYQSIDLPDWMMTDLGVLVARGDVTVDEFMLALQYVLEHA